MLGPLPTLYRVIVSVCAVLACVGLGAWLAHTLPIPLVAGAGAGIGAGIGVVVVLLLTRDFGDREGPSRGFRTHGPRPH